MHVLHPAKYGSGLTPIGYLSWQGDSKNGWYALRFNMDAELSNHAYLLTMYKLACYIKERAIDPSPIEVMGIIGADVHVYDYGMYIPLSDNGKYVYDVHKQSDPSMAQTRITAVNEVMAFRIIDGMVRRNELADVSYTIKASHARLNKVAPDLSIATESTFKINN